MSISIIDKDTLLVFPDDAEELSKSYEKEELLLTLKYYLLIRNVHGIYAPTQGKFVPSEYDLDEFDCRFEGTTAMEKLLKKHKQEVIDYTNSTMKFV